MEAVKKEEVPKVTNLERFQKAIEEIKDGIEIVGDVLFVERLPKREVKKGSLYLATSADQKLNTFGANQPEWVRVLAIGKGYYDDETKKDIALEVKPGDIIEVAKVSVNWFSMFGSVMDNVDQGMGIGITRDTERRVVFRGQEAYDNFMKHFLDDA